MIFLSNRIDSTSYTLIHNTFFEQILPYIDSAYLKVYFYSFYLAANIDKVGIKTNAQIANELHIPETDVLSAFDYLEKCNLIRKHHIENSSADNYSVEILPIEKYAVKSETSYEEEYLTQKNENLKNMYDNIEEIIQRSLNANEIRKIDTVIKNNDLSYDVVVEAFKFVYYNKKSSSITTVMSTIKQWISDGIHTSNDLDSNLFNINERYATYRKILKYFGEYRLPTKPEIKIMNKWIDDYNFSIEVIEKAIDETLKIKTPNFKYLDAIMDNWQKLYTANKELTKTNQVNYADFKAEIMFHMNMDSLDNSQEKMMSFLYKNYKKDIVLSAIDYIKKDKKRDFSLNSLFDFITSSSMDDKLESETVITFGNISLEQMEKVLQAHEKQREAKKPKTKENQKEKSFVNTPALSGKELEEFLLEKNDLDNF